MTGIALLGGWMGYQLWQSALPWIRSNERFLLPDDRVVINAQPEWLLADVRGQVLRNAAIDGRLSLLDDAFVQVVHDAFVLHPWVEKVERIEKSYPPALRVDLVFREPIAAIETQGPNGTLLCPIDRRGVHLPAQDLPNIRLQYLPRIANVAGAPPVGQPWDDPRVAGGVDLTIRLAPLWEPLHLVAVVPSALPEIIRNESRYFVYDIVARGGTRIVWGAAPLAAPREESTFDEKLARLQRAIAEVGPLDTVRSPREINVRGSLQINQSGL